MRSILLLFYDLNLLLGKFEIAYNDFRPDEGKGIIGMRSTFIGFLFKIGVCKPPLSRIKMFLSWLSWRASSESFDLKLVAKFLRCYGPPPLCDSRPFFSDPQLLAAFSLLLNERFES